MSLKNLNVRNNRIVHKIRGLSSSILQRHPFKPKASQRHDHFTSSSERSSQHSPMLPLETNNTNSSRSVYERCEDNCYDKPHNTISAEMVQGQSTKVVSFLKVLIFLTIAISFVYVVISLEAVSDKWRDSKSSGNLFLTPFINAGNISEGRERAKVHLFPEVESYSGFFTVDESCKSHLFFWFFPAASGNLSAPLILWHGGGPGTSGMFALFQGTGPILLHEDGKSWKENHHSWGRHRSILYLDNPVGVGFSYSELGEVCYANSNDDVAESALSALRQFFQLFPEFQDNQFYISTSSYGGKFIPAIAWRIDNDNELDRKEKANGNSNLTSINLKGLISISGFSDPIHQIDYGDFYYNMGFIDNLQLQYMQSQEVLAKVYMRNKQFYEAYLIIDPLIVGTKDGGTSYLRNVTGITNPFNFIDDLMEDPNKDLPIYRQNIFLNQDWVQRAIHVNASEIGRNFTTTSGPVYFNLVAHLYRSVANLVEDLLDSGYKFLCTSGQLDLIVPHTTISKFLHSLRWDGSSDFKRGNMQPWKFRGQTVGYEKSIMNLTYLMFRNVGHHPFVDKPEWAADALLQFTQ